VIKILDFKILSIAPITRPYLCCRVQHLPLHPHNYISLIILAY